MKLLRNTLPLLFLCALGSSVQGQQTVLRALAWPSAITVPGKGAGAGGTVAPDRSANPVTAALAFPGAALDMDRNELPLFSEVIPLGMRTTSVSAYVRDARYVPLNNGAAFP